MDYSLLLARKKNQIQARYRSHESGSKHIQNSFKRISSQIQMATAENKLDVGLKKGY